MGGNPEMFQQAIMEGDEVAKRGSRQQRLELYALKQQGTVGDNNEPEPNILKRKAKKQWQAWSDKRGMSTMQAQQEYVSLVQQLKTRTENGSSSSSDNE